MSPHPNLLPKPPSERHNPPPATACRHRHRHHGAVVPRHGRSGRSTGRSVGNRGGARRPPDRFLRTALTPGVWYGVHMAGSEHGSKAWVGGVVTHGSVPQPLGHDLHRHGGRNGPDERGGVGRLLERYRKVARSAPALPIRGRIECQGAVVNIVAERHRILPPSPPNNRPPNARIGSLTVPENGTHALPMPVSMPFPIQSRDFGRRGRL